LSKRILVWEGLEGWRAEIAQVELTPGGIRASGTQLGVDPLPYRLDYRLEAPEEFVTRRLQVECAGEGWWRGLTLAHDGSGSWTCEAEAEGDVDLPAPGADAGALSGALDCDLGFSPLTNLMPIRRHRLHEDEGERDFLMAWVSVPDLAVHSSAQRYRHLRRGEDGATVRFVDKGLFEGFVADLELDSDGFVSVYPELARRVS
jgi:uncharacterized protein